MERNTSQRRAITNAFRVEDRPLSPREILAGASSHGKIGIATVYRAIKGMLEEGLLQAVEIPGEPSRYELSGKLHHHHFLCRTCDRLFEIEGCDTAHRSAAPRGFRVESHDVLLRGLCAGCRKRA